MSAEPSTSASEPTLADLRQHVEKVSSLVDAAGRHVADGRSVDLAPLESKVAQMCDAIHRATPAQRGGLLKPVESILARLDRLEACLVDQRKANDASTKSSLRQHALDAYRRPQDGR
jgi:hypothetical protein